MRLIIKICKPNTMSKALRYLNLNRGKIRKLIILTLLLVVQSSWVVAQQTRKGRVLTIKDVRVGAQRFDQYLDKIKNKGVGIVANHTSVIGQTHLVDSLISLGIDIKVVLAPEHGFRGHADAGQHVKDFKDSKTRLPVKSLYGKHKKPTQKDLKGVDVLLFDIQDVGVRYYTYISTMHYVMEACAEQGIEFIVLDRPNPNGFYVDGPVLDKKFKSFVGMHEVPLVHGMTIGEYAQMINNEEWLANGVKCNLEVIKVEGYTHSDYFQVPIKPSPNLPNMASIYLYPNLGLFEGTKISVGRGTDFPFQTFGAPGLKAGDFQFTPRPTLGAKHPKYNKKQCRGFDLREFGKSFVQDSSHVYLNWVLVAYQNYNDKDKFFLRSGFFNLLAGTDQLKKQIITGKSLQEIQHSWQSDVQAFKTIRKKYILYKDFE